MLNLLLYHATNHIQDRYASLEKMYENFVPKSEVLKKHIFNFSVLNTFKGKISYLAFPQLGTSIGLYSNSDIKTEDSQLLISNTEDQNIQVLVLGKYKLPLKVIYDIHTPEISINFTPTGLNYFFKEDTNSIAKNRMQFLPSKQWESITRKIFGQTCNHQRIETLESFLVENLIEKEISEVEYCISVLSKHPEYKVSQIAEKLNVTTRTLNRWFINYIGCSPTDFKKISRFRKAIQMNYSPTFKNLTEICFEGGFYDSPHFNREFKKLTNLSPRDFFSRIETVSEKKIPYKFIDV